MWPSRVLLADPDGRWWTNEQIRQWEREARLHINHRFELDVRTADVQSVGGLVSLASVVGRLRDVGGLKRWTDPPPAMLAGTGTPVGWVLDGGAARLFPRPVGEPVVRIAWLPDPPVLPWWAEAGVPLYVAAQAYGSYGPNLSMDRAARWRELWNRWLAGLADLHASHAGRWRLDR